MTELKSPRTGDSIFVEDHASGLKIMIYPKPGYRCLLYTSDAADE